MARRRRRLYRQPLKRADPDDLSPAESPQYALSGRRGQGEFAIRALVMSGRREPFHQPVEEGVVAALALTDRALNQVVARDERGAGGQGRRLPCRRVDVLALLALHPARQPLQQFLARLKEFARPTSGAAGLNGLGQKTKRQREVRLVLAQRLEQVFAEIPIGIRPPGDAQFHRKTSRIRLAETRREALDGLGGPRQRRLPVLVDKGQQAFG